ncbi:GPI ethanolamine phosphate transferase 2-like [Uloborus diversus]|uniref:GPI ethanolamine phosphate transferase 2-like n=1 Tax=Uloborus diversus TaxID=327109 RepID=UPI002409D688|nr:GPI ethanolamine phosphate transferase 2-like [Uloborus diversus]
MYGFFSVNNAKLKPVSTRTLLSKCNNFVPQNQQHVCNYQIKTFGNKYVKHYEKIILIVIDALRADFISSVLPNSDFEMLLPFTESLIRQQLAIPFVTEVFSPTVTMPRIKTLVTGTVSNFMDVFLNLNATQMLDDNIIYQTDLKNMKTIFFGDETWLKLFPNSFLRSEGTHSFFVSDFTEVDNNVTRNVNAELQNTDWTVMILHYLGVDHIGHSYGPHSHYLPKKLKEMDDIIQHIYRFIKNRYKKQSLIVICGDHGMSSSGSHGGMSSNEILTPTIFINSKTTISMAGATKVMKQVDFAPTLSVLLGIPIPINSYGSIMPDVLQFSGLSEEEILNAAFYNMMQLYEIHRHTFPEKSVLLTEKLQKVIMIFDDWFRNVEISSESLNVSCNDSLLAALDMISAFQQDLLRSGMNYNEPIILLGMWLMWLSFLWLFFSLSTDIFAYDENFTLLNMKIISLSVICACLMILFIFTYHLSIFVGLVLFSLSFISIIILYKLFQLLKHINAATNFELSDKMYICFGFLHLLSLFSSSYIEEEHQTWYFLTSTMLTFHFLKHFLYILILVTHRILRKWNQTGNKWQTLSDISDWISKDENRSFCLILMLLAQITVMFYLWKKSSTFLKCMTFSGLTSVLVYKCPFSFLMVEKKSLLISWIIYMHSLILLLSFLIQIPELSSNKSKLKYFNVISSWILLIELIGRAYNIPLIATTLVQEHCLNELTWKKSRNIFSNTAMYLIMTMTAFFYIGNSNNLSTIDLFSGYTGLSSYQPIIVGVLLVCNTYSTVMLWLLLMMHRMLNFHASKFSNSNEDTCVHLKRNVAFCFNILFAHRLFILSVYSIVIFIMKFHLFIMSVFLPKFIYETSHVLFFLLVNLFVTIFVCNFEYFFFFKLGSIYR